MSSVSFLLEVTVCYKIDTWAKAGGLYVISPSDWNSVSRDMRLGMPRHAES